ncbi:MAG: hypothetical protein ACT4O5_00310 [Gammaproteobacteria bacterium]
MAGDALNRFALVCGLATGLGGCTTTILAPADPVDPVEVFIIDHGRTASLVIPSSSGGMLRYAYGEWRWYALRETGPLRALSILFWPKESALGRGGLAGPPTFANVSAQVAGAERVHPVRVERERVRAFEQKIEALYRSRLDTEVETPTMGLRFVHHPRRYTYFHNSNHVVAAWLRELGCRTRGRPFHSSWRVVTRVSAP